MIKRKIDVRTEFKISVDRQWGSRKDSEDSTFRTIIGEKKDFSLIINVKSHLIFRKKNWRKETRVKIRKTGSVLWPWVGAAFLWQISEIVGHTNSFSFGELENLIMWYKTQLSCAHVCTSWVQLGEFSFHLKGFTYIQIRKKIMQYKKKSRIVQRGRFE